MAVGAHGSGAMFECLWSAYILAEFAEREGGALRLRVTAQIHVVPVVLADEMAGGSQRCEFWERHPQISMYPSKLVHAALLGVSLIGGRHVADVAEPAADQFGGHCADGQCDEDVSHR